MKISSTIESIIERPPIITQVAPVIGLPLKEWAGNCRLVCQLMVTTELVSPALSPCIVDGVWVGPIAPGTMYDGKKAVKHSWIEVEYKGYEHIIDPTRYLFDGFTPDDKIWCGHNDGSYRSVNLCARDVSNKLAEFLQTYASFRTNQNLPECPNNPLEITNGLADKVGRVARLVKHNRRGDPKPDWEADMAQELAGVLNYIVVCANYHGLCLSDGFTVELAHAVEDHGV